MAISMGLMLGGLINLYHTMSRGYTGLPAERIVRFTGHVARDSIPLQSGGYGCAVHLDSVSDRQGNKADSRGTVFVISPMGEPLSWGAKISVDSPLQWGEEETEGFSAFASPENIDVHGWRHSLFALRHRVVESLHHRCTLLYPRSEALFKALYFGDRDDLNIFDIAAFRKAGCSHILALSGMHLGIISGFLLIVLRLFFRGSLSVHISIICVWTYIMLAGVGASLVRAGVMYTLTGLSLVYGRKTDLFQIFLFSFIVTVLLIPGEVRTLSFQFSFLALCGIMLIARNAHFRLSPYLPGWLAAALACSFSAHLFTSPLTAAVFQEVYPVGILASLVVTPLIFMFLWSGMIFLVIADVPLLGELVATGMEWLYRGMDETIRVFAGAPSLTFHSTGTAVVYAGMMAAVLLVLYVPGRRRRV